MSVHTHLYVHVHTHLYVHTYNILMKFVSIRHMQEFGITVDVD